MLVCGWFVAIGTEVVGRSGGTKALRLILHLETRVSAARKTPGVFGVTTFERFFCVAVYPIVAKLTGMSSLMSLKNWLSCDQASRIIGCTADHVRLLARNGQIQAQKFGPRTWLIDRKSAEKMAKEPQQTGRPRKNAKN